MSTNLDPMHPITAEVLPDSVVTPAALNDSGARAPSGQPPVLRRMWMGNSDLIAAIWLSGSLICLIMAGLMSIGTDRRVYLPGIQQPVPELCWMYKNLRIDCPGCGLTRTFIHMAHARPIDALETSPIGVLVFLFACIQVPMGMAQVIFRQRGPWIEYWGFVNDWSVAGLLIALLVQWGIKLII